MKNLLIILMLTTTNLAIGQSQHWYKEGTTLICSSVSVEGIEEVTRYPIIEEEKYRSGEKVRDFYFVDDYVIILDLVENSVFFSYKNDYKPFTENITIY